MAPRILESSFWINITASPFITAEQLDCGISSMIMASVVIAVTVLIMHYYVNEHPPQESSQETDTPLYAKQGYEEDDIAEIDRKFLKTLAGLPDIISDETDTATTTLR